MAPNSPALRSRRRASAPLFLACLLVALFAQTRRPLAVMAAVGIAATLTYALRTPASAQDCLPTAPAGVDIAVADTSVLAFFCRGVGEVFLATDTLIRSVSVWRPPMPALDGRARELFITEVFSDPAETPDVGRLLLDAGPLIVQSGDGIHPVEYRWLFDPPFALPHAGKFFFAVQAGLYSSWLVPAARTDPYPGGRAWETTANFDCSRPAGAYADAPPYVDLAFEVEFCKTGVTPLGRRTWGSLKITYR